MLSPSNESCLLRSLLSFTLLCSFMSSVQVLLRQLEKLGTNFCKMSGRMVVLGTRNNQVMYCWWSSGVKHAASFVAFRHLLFS